MANTSVTLYADENFGGDRKPDITTEQPNLTLSPINLTNGASSMAIGSNASKWDVYTEANYHGVSNTLFPGKFYNTVQSMGLASPVYSMRPSTIGGYQLNNMAKASVTLYSDENLGGDRKPDITTEQPNLTLSPINLTNGASSMEIGSNASKWDVYTEANYHGVFNTLFPGKFYNTIESMELAGPVYSMRPSTIGGNQLNNMANASVTLYEDENFGGDRKPDITTEQPNLTLSPINLTNGASSMKIGPNAVKWDVYTEANYHGVSSTLYPGKYYKTIQSMGISSPVYSMRPS